MYTHTCVPTLTHTTHTYTHMQVEKEKALRYSPKLQNWSRSLSLAESLQA